MYDVENQLLVEWLKFQLYLKHILQVCDASHENGILFCGGNIPVDRSALWAPVDVTMSVDTFTLCLVILKKGNTTVNSIVYQQHTLYVNDWFFWV
jgi:hypothetical protein